MTLPGTFDEEAFGVAYEHGAEGDLERLGFATTSRPVRTLPSERREELVAYRIRAAHELVTDVQQWIIDDDAQVSGRAQDGLRNLLASILTADRNPRERVRPRPGLLDGTINRLDNWLGRWLGHADPDGPEPWWASAALQRRVRQAALGVAGLAAVGNIAAVLLRAPLVALALLLTTGLAVWFERAFTRFVQGGRSGLLRWFSCVVGQLLELSFAASVALVAPSRTAAAAVAGGLILALFGSYARTSALQVGHRLWLSREERVLRYMALASYCALSLVGHSLTGVLAVALVFALGGLMQLIRTVRVICTGPSMESGEIVVFCTDNSLRQLPLSGAPNDATSESWIYRPELTTTSNSAGRRSATSAEARNG